MSPTIRRRPDLPAPDLAHLPPLLARVYAARGVRAASELEHDLARLPLPEQMKGMAQAASRLAAAVMQGESILVIGDYDADGATSTATALLALRAMGSDHADFLVPNRFEFGYGLSPGIVALAARRKPDLIITVDNGISSIDGVAAANALGIDVIITDHHLAGEELPAACAIINPNQPGCEFPSKQLAGVGVVFYLMCALRAVLRDNGWFDRRGVAAPQLAQLLDLVALGTVADLVGLDANNRILVRQGLQRIRSGQGRPGIRALLEIAGRCPERAVSSDLGFAAGPRLNAAGRLEDMALGIRCLLEDDTAYARELAGELDGLNRDRRQIEAAMQQEAIALLDDYANLPVADMPYGICLFHPQWHQGVVGLVAARMKERHHRPVIAFARGNEGELKGSARSIAGFHVRDALAAIHARQPQLIGRFGGHAMAAGLSLREDHFEAFAQAFAAEARRLLSADDLQGVLDSDGELAVADLSLQTAEALREAGPWGQHFPEPLFDGEFALRQQRLVGERHLKLTVSPLAAPAHYLDAIAFGVDRALWPNPQVSIVRLAYRLDVNEYRGTRALQLLVEHLDPVRINP